MQTAIRRSLITLLVLLPFHAPVTTYLISRGFPEAQTEVWKEVLAGVIVLLILYWQRADLAEYISKLPRKTVAIAGIVVAWLASAFFMGGAEDLPRVVSAVIYGRIALYVVLGWLVARYRLLSSRELLKAGLWITGVVISFGILQMTILPDDFLENLGYQPGIIEAFQLVDEDPDRVRIISTLRGPNPLGWFMAFALPILLVKLFASKSRRDVMLYGGSFAAGLAVLFGSYSRSGLLAAAIACGALVLVQAPKQWRAKIIAVSGALVIAFGLTVVSVPELRNEILFHDSAEVSNVTADSERFSSIARNASAVLATPFGHGLGTAGPAAFFSTASSEARVTESFANQIGYELGVLAVFAFYGGLLWLVWRQYQWQREKAESDLSLLNNVVIAGMVGWLTVSLVAPVFTDDIVVFYGFMYLGYIANKLKTEAAD